MPTTDLNQRVKRIIGLSDAELVLVQTDGITSEDDLLYAQFVDLNATIPVIKHWKLNSISQFLAKGGVLDANITMARIQKSLHAPPAPAGGLAAGYTGAAPNPNHGAPKVYTDMLADFSGKAVDYDDWERKAGATIKKTQYKDFLVNPATVDDVVEEARSKELYNMILLSVS